MLGAKMMGRAQHDHTHPRQSLRPRTASVRWRRITCTDMRYLILTLALTGCTTTIQQMDAVGCDFRSYDINGDHEHVECYEGAPHESTDYHD